MSLIHKLEAYQRVQNRIKDLHLKGRDSEAIQLKEILDKITLPEETQQLVPLQDSNSAILELTNLVHITIQELKTLNEIKATVSISYDKILNEAVRRKLVTDNLRMEQVYHDILISETERFHSFCTNAFFQVENLLTYYYGLKYPILEDCIQYLERLGTKFKDKPKSLSDIPANNFLTCFEKEYFHGKVQGVFFDSTLQKIRTIRNSNLHRCSIIIKDSEKIINAYHALIKHCKDFKYRNKTNYHKTEEDKRIEREGKAAEFLKEKNYDSVRKEVSNLYDIVTSNLTQ